MDYQANRFDTNTFIITSVVLIVFIIMVVCFLRAFMRFLQNNYVSKDHSPERYENSTKVNIPERRIPTIVRSSNTSLHSVRSTRQNTQPVVRQYSKYKVTRSTDTVDHSDYSPSASLALLRHEESTTIVPSARPPSYQEAMASSRENLTDLCQILNGK